MFKYDYRVLHNSNIICNFAAEFLIDSFKMIAYDKK